MKSCLKYSGLFFAVLAFFVLTFPANHCEAEDTYYYARMAEQGVWSEMFHSHHLLYLPAMRLLFCSVQALGYSGHSLPVLIGFSMVCGAGSLCLFQSLLRRRGVRESLVWIFSLTLLFSYGFWRYSTTAEIYIPVTFLSLGTLCFADRSSGKPIFLVLSILCASLALLTHLIALPVILLAVPLWIAAGQERRKVFLYCVLTLLLVGAGYAAAASGPGLTVFRDAQVARETLFSPRTWVKGGAAWSQNLLSANFLFALPAAAEKIESLFPYHMLQEELFMGRQTPRWAAMGALATLGVAAMLFLGVFWRGVLSLRWAWGADSLRTVAVLAWLGGSAGMALLFEPANPEMWIAALAPFWLMMALCIGRESGAKVDVLAGLLTFALLSHNLIGGIVPVKSPGSDYCRQKAGGVVELLQAGDVVLTAESHSFVTFLQYQTPAKVVDAKFISPEQWALLSGQSAGRIFVFDDVVNLLPPVARRSEESVQDIQRTAALLKPGLVPVFENEQTELYRYR